MENAPRDYCPVFNQVEALLQQGTMKEGMYTISINSSNLRLKRSLRLLLHYELGALSLRYLRLRDYHC